MPTEFKPESQGQDGHRTERPKEMKFTRPMPPVFATLEEESSYRKARLVLGCRVLAREGYGFCGTCISERDPLQSDSIWTHPVGLALSTITEKDLIQLTFDGQVRTKGARGSNYDKSAVALHFAIYTTPGRTDITAICHSQAPHSRAFAMADRELKMINQDAATFYKACTTIPAHSALDAAKDPAAVHQAVGNAKIAILASHGGLAVHQTIEGCVGYFLRLDGLCFIQMLAEAAEKGRGIPMVYVSEEAAQITVKGVGGPHHAWLLARPNFTREERFFEQEKCTVTAM